MFTNFNFGFQVLESRTLDMPSPTTSRIGVPMKLRSPTSSRTSSVQSHEQSYDS